jgi:hypothetical protein
MRVACVLLLLAATSATQAGQAPVTVSDAYVLSYETLARAGDRQTIRRLLNLEVDGAAAEAVSVVVGRAIRQHPDTFLDEVAKNHRAQCASCLASLVGALGDEYVDDDQRQLDELLSRRDALGSVDIRVLRPLRDKCIVELDAQIRQLRSFRKQSSVHP